MTHFEIDDMREGYTRIGHTLLKEGKSTLNARTSSTIREMLGISIRLTNPADALPVGVNRKLNPAIGAAEALQLIGGWSDPEWLCRIAPNMRQFMDGGILHGAYGPRLMTQLPRTILRLERDKTSRQAVVTVWDPQHDSDDGPADLPCTITLQWLVRDGALHAFTYMRSNDFWWGFAYDVFQFTQLQLTMANYLRLKVGEYHHHVGSFHAYERDWAGIQDLTYPENDEIPDVSTGLYTGICTKWKAVQTITKKIAHGDPVHKEAITPTIEWYKRVLGLHRTV